MDVTTFHCPLCRAALRMRGRQTAGTRFHCPDCEQPLQITAAEEGTLSLSPVESEPVPQGPSPLTLKTTAALTSIRQGLKYLAASPVLLSWIVAGTGGLAILLMILFDESPTLPQPEIDAGVKADENQEPAADQPLLPEVAAEPEPGVPEPAAPEIPTVPAPDQFAHQTLIAVKPKQIPPLVARKPDPQEEPAVPATDVTIALQIPILEFRQSEEIPLSTLISQFEEMLDTKFLIADNVKNDPRLLETPVSFSQKNTNLSRLLTQILSEAALTFSVKSNKIHIERAEGS
ncbi:hypothetical protein [Gimesia chilikensis]|uniref:hypothetical protein n=1 Tax=Gimesia chilikensis TaxID=2605989 RepID=UPI00118A9595|nr:hypothetical protein [Gimesia chilikensis]QDT87910.1 hypothetical protein MalM14_56040 [Gimesia chilikensis]